MFLYGFLGVVLGFIDLYFSWDDFEKISFNLCTTFLVTGTLAKNFLLSLNISEINELRRNLFLDSLELSDEKEIEITSKFKKMYLTLGRFLYFCVILLLGAWLISSICSLKWGPRELPFPLWLPLDLNNDSHFAFGFIFHAVSCIYVGAETISADLCIFSLIFQITAQFRILEKNIAKINEFYDKGSDPSGPRRNRIQERNKAFLDFQAKKLLVACVKKHLKLCG